MIVKVGGVIDDDQAGLTTQGIREINVLKCVPHVLREYLSCFDENYYCIVAFFS